MLIKNGIVSSDTINIIQKLILESHTYSRPQYLMTPIYITIHNTGDNGASALAISDYVTSQTGYKSWHFTVGNGVIYQHLPITESSWNAGDGQNGTGNRESISIEICEVSGAEETAIKFVAELLKITGLNIEKVVPHKHWSGKICPRLILPHWDVFIDNIKKEMIGLTLDEAKKLVQSKAGLDNNSMQYLEFYRSGEDLIKKLAVPMVNNIIVKEPTIEQPIVDNSIGYSRSANDTFQQWGNPKQLSTKIVNQKNNTIQEPHSMNSIFFWWLDTARTQCYPTSIYIKDGVILRNEANHLDAFNAPQSVFIVYKDGRVEIRKVKYATELDYKNIVVGVGGIGLKDSNNPNFKYDPASEGFKKGKHLKTGVTVDYSDVLRQTTKAVVGYNIKEDKVYLMMRPNIYHSHPLYYDLLELVDDCKYDLAVSLDGGSSCFYNNADDMVFTGSGRVIYSIIGFNLN